MILFLSSILTAWAGGSDAGLEIFESRQLLIAGKLIRLEIADTPNRRRQGLMFRSRLGDNAGMIFTYKEAGDHRIWMKNTLIPLTVVWIDKMATVIGIKKINPCKQEKCPVYSVLSPSKYIIEFNIKYNDLKLR